MKSQSPASSKKPAIALKDLKMKKNPKGGFTSTVAVLAGSATLQPTVKNADGTVTRG